MMGGLNAVMGESKPPKNSPYFKNSLLSSFLMLGFKLKGLKEFAFNSLLRKTSSSQLSTTAHNNNSTAITVEQGDSLKFKGRVLMGLKEYPKLNLKHSFWHWYLNSTDSG